MESLYKYWKILRENRKEVSEKYLVSILKNSAISYLRRQSAHRNAMDAISESYRKDLELRLNSITSCDPEILFSDEIRKIYRKTMESLPAKTAMIFEMRKNDRLPVKQIARITGISEKTVEYHITKAIKALRSGLSEYLPAFIVFCIIMKIKSECRTGARSGGNAVSRSTGSRRRTAKLSPSRSGALAKADTTPI